MRSFDLSYDYRCPFAKNIHLHAITALRDGADLDIRFVPWTMSQGYKADGAPDVWDDVSRDDELAALAVSTSIRDLQSDRFLDAHEALFLARHERGVRLSGVVEVLSVVGPLGVDVAMIEADLATRRPHQVIGESFREFERYEAFGVPTFVVGGDATFVRYMTGPTSDAAASSELIQSLVTMIERQSDLNEFKHTRVAY